GFQFGDPVLHVGFADGIGGRVPGIGRRLHGFDPTVVLVGVAAAAIGAGRVPVSAGARTDGGAGAYRLRLLAGFYVENRQLGVIALLPGHGGGRAGAAMLVVVPLRFHLGQDGVAAVEPALEVVLAQ